MSAHTPGPWTAVQDGNVDWYIVDENESVIVFGLSEPDARLIAAAPDMLDLARNVAGIDHRYLNTNNDILLRAVLEWMEQARAAIAKAEGTS